MHPDPLLLISLVVLLAGVICLAEETVPEGTSPAEGQIRFPQRHPYLACTPQERDRLRGAYQAGGAASKPLIAIIQRADQALTHPVEFPPRGGQHNQWYQCSPCQTGLQTIDATHHRCPKCKKIYSGSPYDDAYDSRRHSRLLDAARDCAWAYAITGEQRYARRTADILVGYGQRYLQYPRHDNRLSTGDKAAVSGAHIFEQTLTEAARMATSIAGPYDLIHDSGVLTEDEHRTIVQGLILPMLRNIDRYKAGKSNWQSWHNAAMLWGGAVIGQDEWVRKALYDPDHGFFQQMRISVTNEGMWYENSWSYHRYTLSAMVQLAQGAQRVGIDVWSHPRLKSMFTLPMRYQMPGGMLPRFADAVDMNLAGMASHFEAAYHAYGDEAFLAFLPDEPTLSGVMFGRDHTQSSPPPLESEVFPGAGHAILRSRGDRDMAAAITFGEYGGFHGHFDKLSFVFYAFGRELAVDPGRAASQAYRLPIHKDWYKATISHNTVVVNGQSQAPASGSLRWFEAQSDGAAVTVMCDQAYPGVRHQRTLVLTDRYLLVADDLQSDKPQDYTWIYHNTGQSVTSNTATAPAKLPDSLQGAGYIQNVRQCTTDKPVTVNFHDENHSTRVVLAGAADTRITLGDGPLASVLQRVPMVMADRRANRTRFVAVIEPLGGKDKPLAQAVTVHMRQQDRVITVTTHGGSDVFVIHADGSVTCPASP